MKEFEKREKELQKLINKRPSILPEELKSTFRWIQIISDNLFPWKLAYEVFVSQYLAPYVEEMNKEILKDYGRIGYRIDIENPNKIKSPFSIAEKILRNLKSYSSSSPQEFIMKNMAEMDDIARCRILCNYISDMDEIDSCITSDEFELPSGIKYCKDKKKDKRIEAGRSFKKGAHRAIHEYYKCQLNEKCYYIEVQIMTFLQEAWDIKQHLIYEEIRRGKNNKETSYIQDRFHVLSGLLLIADEFAEETMKKWIRSKKANTEEE